MKSFSHRGNFPSTMTSDEIKKCTYHPEKSPFCPIFRVGDVLNYTGQSVAGLADKVWSILYFIFPAVSPLKFPSSSRLKCCSCTGNYAQSARSVDTHGKRRRDCTFMKDKPNVNKMSKSFRGTWECKQGPRPHRPYLIWAHVWSHQHLKWWHFAANSIHSDGITAVSSPATAVYQLAMRIKSRHHWASRTKCLENTCYYY